MWIGINPVHIKHLSSVIKLLAGGKSFFYKTWLDKGLCYIRDLIDNESNFLDFHAFTQLTSINTTFLQFQGVTECIKKLMKY